ncbi:MAG: hypothetical protein J1G38_03295 [Clostridiales bacterium]|nr:hypothetical protein [Clostridiales bacterium]
MLNRFKNFFKELFKNDIGEYNPEATKVHFTQVLYWIIGLIICFLIPTCLVYLEVRQFDWNVFNFIWGEKAQAYGDEVLYRGGYFVGGLCANISFLVWGFLSTYIINGQKEMLGLKRCARFFFVICIIFAVSCFIVAITY